MGSAAAAAYGITVEPRDFDIVPETSSENLARPTEQNPDHLYETPHGLFDVVPLRARRYALRGSRSSPA